MTNKVLEHIAQNYENVRKGVHDVMGGQVLEYETKTIWKGGVEEGKREMAVELYRRGMETTEIAKIAKEYEDTVREWLEGMKK